MWLVRNGLRHSLHPPIPGAPGRSTNLLVAGVYVFIQGRFWHDPRYRSLSMSIYWREKMRTNARRDRDTRRLLRAAGARYAVIWDDQDVVAALARVVRGSTPFSRVG